LIVEVRNDLNLIPSCRQDYPEPDAVILWRAFDSHTIALRSFPVWGMAL
jgi:hypothetical protein